MIDVDCCTNILAKIAIEKIGLKAEPHPLIQRELGW